MTDTPILNDIKSTKAPIRIERILQGWIILAVPILLVIGSVRLVMTPLFLQLEYTRPGFPEDTYGFTTEDRLLYAPYTLNYLMNGEDIDYLGDLRLPGDKCFPPTSAELECPMYNDLELRHMHDVKGVTRTAFFVGIWGGLISVIAVIVLLRVDTSLHYLQLGLLQGSMLTLMLIAAIIIGAIAAWRFFFDLFHEVLFEEGTWRFYFSDTLIRLFPEQFWFDAALTVGGITVIAAMIIFALSWQWGKTLTYPR